MKTNVHIPFSHSNIRVPYSSYDVYSHFFFVVYKTIHRLLYFKTLPSLTSRLFLLPVSIFGILCLLKGSPTEVLVRRHIQSPILPLRFGLIVASQKVSERHDLSVSNISSLGCTPGQHYLQSPKVTLSDLPVRTLHPHFV